MAITSEDIHNQSFNTERRGYDVDEVDVFLERVADEIDDLNAEIAQLRRELEDAQSISSRGAGLEDESELAAKDARIADLEARLRDRKNEDSAIAQALIVAQRTGDEIVSKSKAEAEHTRQNAEEEARRILDKAGDEKQKVLDQITELNESREAIRAHYQDMLKDFIGSATKRLSEIGGEVTSDFEMPKEYRAPKHGVSTSGAADSEPAPEHSKWEPSPMTATYTTPTVSSVVSAPATPKPSAPSKDLSGYGDADDSFVFDDLD